MHKIKVQALYIICNLLRYIIDARHCGFNKKVVSKLIRLFLVSVARLELARLATMDSKSILSTIPTHRRWFYDATGNTRRIFISLKTG